MFPPNFANAQARYKSFVTQNIPTSQQLITLHDGHNRDVDSAVSSAKQGERV
jgi:hypothetical protein